MTMSCEDPFESLLQQNSKGPQVASTGPILGTFYLFYIYTVYIYNVFIPQLLNFNRLYHPNNCVICYISTTM